MSYRKEKMVLTIQLDLLILLLAIVGGTIPFLILKYLPVWCFFVFMGGMGLFVLHSIAAHIVDTTLRQK